MFDAITSQLLQSAPSLPGLDSGQLPQLLTRHYAELVSARLKGDMDNVLPEGQWSLERIADAYEIIASIEEEPALRRAAAFVAGTAQQIISRRLDEPNDDNILSPIDRDGVNASAAAAILFLVAEQYADANEASFAIPADRGPREIKALGKHIKDLARGHLNSILQRANRWRQQEPIRGSIQMRALRLLAATISEGIELLAADMMSAEVPEATPKRFENAQEAFRRVINMSTHVEADTEDVFGGRLRTAYAGPAHLASLLLSAADTIEQSALTKLSPPNGADVMFWKKWLRFRAVEMPFIWPNHREAIEKNFYQTGTSAVLVLPTGAGKTTISALKIAGTLARGMKVIFLAPTHALVEQLTEDLQAIFPQDMFGSEVSSDFDSLLLDDAQLQDIEVMTPERCLAMLSFSASSFQNVGLLVFDECHLLSPQSQKIGRALDGMLCLLAFRAAAAEADMLFLSAMLKNGPQFAEWIADLTGRPCQSIDLLWKPSRQARGVVVYEKAEFNESIIRAQKKQSELNNEQGKTAKTLRREAKSEIMVTPYVVWGLQHNWISVSSSYALTPIANTPMQLAGKVHNGKVWVSPNANQIAVKIAVSANTSGLKTIVFVNTKADAIRCARQIVEEHRQTVVLSEKEQVLWDALVQELGDSKHSVFGEQHFIAVPHNSSMLRLERSLSEKLFKRKDGAHAIIATPTLAQGLNLPAHLAILAGDRRAGGLSGKRENLEAHEILNAAARAGRAGYLANGLVILIPEPIITFSHDNILNDQLKCKLTSVLPEDDRCVSITDPLEVVLDRIMAGELDDREVTYTVNRLATLTANDEDGIPSDNLLWHSFGAFLAHHKAEQEIYRIKVETLLQKTREVVANNSEVVVVSMASHSGLPLDLLGHLKRRLLDDMGSLPITVEGWVDWTINWLRCDALARKHLLQDVSRSMCKVAGKSANTLVDAEMLDILVPGLKGWISGRPLNEIETSLGGDPNGKTDTLKMCPRARELISTFIPRGLSFIIGVVARMVEELELASNQEELDESLLRSLSAAVRRGFDSVEKLEFANNHKEILSRVQLHKRFDESFSILDFDDDL